MNFEQIDVTGSRLVGAITELGHVGPKHHGIVIGRNIFDGNVYVAENCHTGYQLATVDDFSDRYSPNADLIIFPNDGKFTNSDVAGRALREIKDGGEGKYNLGTNNCESFSNRAMYNSTFSSQVVNTFVGLVILTGICLYARKTRLI